MAAITEPPKPALPEHNRTGVSYRRPMPRPKVRGSVIDAHCHLLADRHADIFFAAADHFGFGVAPGDCGVVAHLFVGRERPAVLGPFFDEGFDVTTLLRNRDSAQRQLGRERQSSVQRWNSAYRGVQTPSGMAAGLQIVGNILDLMRTSPSQKTPTTPGLNYAPVESRSMSFPSTSGSVSSPAIRMSLTTTSGTPGSIETSEV